MQDHFGNFVIQKLYKSLTKGKSKEKLENIIFNTIPKIKKISLRNKWLACLQDTTFDSSQVSFIEKEKEVNYSTDNINNRSYISDTYKNNHYASSDGIPQIQNAYPLYNTNYPYMNQTTPIYNPQFCSIPNSNYQFYPVYYPYDQNQFMIPFQSMLINNTQSTPSTYDTNNLKKSKSRKHKKNDDRKP